MKVYQKISVAVGARERCLADGNSEWYTRWSETLSRIQAEYLPRGSGFDAGTKIDMERTAENEKIVLTTDFHHMDSNGSYDGWTNHTVVVRPTFNGIAIQINGRDRDGWKEYAYDVFRDALEAEYPETVAQIMTEGEQTTKP